MTLIAIHQWLGYAVFVVALIVTALSWASAQRDSSEPPGALRGLGGALAGLIDLMVLLGLYLWLVMGLPLPSVLHPVLAIAAAIAAHIGARGLRTSEGLSGARWSELATLLLLVAAIGIASM